MLRTVYMYLLFVVGVYFILSTILNRYRDLSTRNSLHKGAINKENAPFVSVLIPARNEEKNIEHCVLSLLSQDYSNYEILILSDNSTDNTYNIIKKLAREHRGKVRAFKGRPLPSGWRGKSYALKQLTKFAKGDIFLLTDADTVHSKTSISFMVSTLIEHNLDMISGYIYQKLKTFGEKVTVPAMYLLTVALPLYLNDILKSPKFATAIGQYIGIKKESFLAIGGYESIKGITTEDMYLARRMKECGYKTGFFDFSRAASCRMYGNGKEALQGIGKNIFDFMGRSNFIMFLSIYGIFCFILLPIVSFDIEAIKYLTGVSRVSYYLLTLLFVNIAFFFTYLTIFYERKLPLYLAFFYPFIFLNLLIIFISGWIKSNFIGYLWKGRRVN